MIENSGLDKLTKKQLKSRVEKLESQVKKGRGINYASTIVAIILGIILIIATVLPSFAGVDVTSGGENIISTGDSTGKWEIYFDTTGFVPANNIVLHVRFLDEHAEIDYNSFFFSITPDVRKLEAIREFEYKWNSYKGKIILFMEVSSDYELKNNTFVQISTDRRLEYRHWGI